MIKSDRSALVIGGAGFVGSHLIELLLKDGWKVSCFDNYFTGSKRNHIEGAFYYEGATKDINEVRFKDGFDVVYHLGEYSRVEQSFEDIDLVFEYNQGSIYNVLKFVKNSGAKLVYSGSSTKFGDNGQSGEESPYAWTKKTNADLVRVYCNWFEIPYAITYFYNVYGPREISEGRYATVIAKYIRLKEMGVSKLPVVSPGVQRRNFTHVEDIVSGLLMVANNGEGDGFGIGSDESFSILELVELFGCSAEMLPERRGNRLSAPVNSEKTKLLGWGAKISLRDYVGQLSLG